MPRKNGKLDLYLYDVVILFWIFQFYANNFRVLGAPQ